MCCTRQWRNTTTIKEEEIKMYKMYQFTEPPLMQIKRKNIEWNPSNASFLPLCSVSLQICAAFLSGNSLKRGTGEAKLCWYVTEIHLDPSIMYFFLYFYEKIGKKKKKNEGCEVFECAHIWAGEKQLLHH